MKFNPSKEYLVNSDDMGCAVLKGDEVEKWLKDESLKNGDTIQELTNRKWVVGSVKIIKKYEPVIS